MSKPKKVQLNDDHILFGSSKFPAPRRTLSGAAKKKSLQKWEREQKNSLPINPANSELAERQKTLKANQLKRNQAA